MSDKAFVLHQVTSLLNGEQWTNRERREAMSQILTALTGEEVISFVVAGLHTTRHGFIGASGESKDVSKLSEELHYHYLSTYSGVVQ